MVRAVEPLKGRIFDVQRMSLLDGPGLPTTVFFQGCPLRCRWCHSPECMLARDRLMVNVERCIGCGACKQACPELVADDPDAHREWTGMNNAGILEAMEHWASRMPGRLWISVRLVPGVHDRDELQRMAEFAASLANRPPVRLLPFERFGESKYRALGQPVPEFDDDPGVPQLARDVVQTAELDLLAV